MSRRTTREINGVLHRLCGGCQRDLPLDSEHFHRSSVKGWGGFEYRCKECESERARWRSLLKLYGLTRADYDAMLEAQGGHCACCPARPVEGGVLDVDHDAISGLVRGLLCRACNVTLGNVGDSPERLERLAEYLRANTVPEGG